MLKIFLGCVLIIPIVLYVLVLIYLYFYQESLLFPAEQLPQDYTFLIDYPYEEIFISVEGEKKSGQESVTDHIHALHVKQANPKGLLFFLHGNAGSLKTWATDLEFYERVNYDLFILDYRGYGKSSGRITSQEQLVNDVSKAYEYISPSYADKPIVIYGRSLGTGLATILAKKFIPELLVLVSPYSSMVDVAKKQYPFVPSSLLRYPLRTDQMIAQVESDMVLIHGEDDTYIPISHSQKLLSLLRNNTELVTVANAGHSDIHQSTDYLDALARVLPDAKTQPE